MFWHPRQILFWKLDCHGTPHRPIDLRCLCLDESSRVDRFDFGKLGSSLSNCQGRCFVAKVFLDHLFLACKLSVYEFATDLQCCSVLECQSLGSPNSDIGRANRTSSY